MSVSPLVVNTEPNKMEIQLQHEIDDMRQLLHDAMAKYGNFTHPEVLQISQSLDQKILQAQRQLMGR